MGFWERNWNPTMDKKELRILSRSELVRIILQQHETISQLSIQVNKLEQYVRAFDNPHTPNGKKHSKKNTERNESKPRFPGKPKGDNGGGIDMPKPDKELQNFQETRQRRDFQRFDVGSQNVTAAVEPG